jgi:hypothetical protein
MSMTRSRLCETGIVPIRASSLAAQPKAKRIRRRNVIVLMRSWLVEDAWRKSMGTEGNKSAGA